MNVMKAYATGALIGKPAESGSGSVAERGGILSHAAIGSPHLKMPGIIRVADATGVVKSVETVTLTSKTGRVVVL
jgi:phosphohistidine swiveling domain-containing protein